MIAIFFCFIFLCNEDYDRKKNVTKNTKESQIKGELELVSMNVTLNFISEKFDEFEKDRRKKDKI